MAGRFDEKIKALRVLVVEPEGEGQSVAELLCIHGWSSVSFVGSIDEAVRRLRSTVVRERHSIASIFVDWDMFLDTGRAKLSEAIPPLSGPAFAIVDDAPINNQIRRRVRSCGFADAVSQAENPQVLVARVETLLLRHYLSLQVRRSDRHNQHLFLNILQLMAKVLEAKDPYTKFHSESVATHAYRIAQQFGYNQDQLEKIAMAGILHDFGKIGVREDILNKPGRLTEEEFKQVQRHPLIASTILEPIEELQSIIADIRHHHEFFDGSGYPSGLGEDDIPLGARILHVAEAYDTMTSDRAYHRARSPAAAVAELRKADGLQFDPRVVEAFLDIQGDSDSEKEAQRERITRTFTARRVQRGVMNVLNSDLENLDDAPSKPAEPDKPETSDESARDRNG